MQTLKLQKKYQQYPEYKDSGIEWLGKIPKEWEIASSRRIFSTDKERVGSNFSDHKILSLTLHGVIPRVLDGSGKNPAEYDTYQIFKKNDIVFCLFDYDVTPRTIGYVEEDGMMTGAYTRLIPRSETFSKYFYYYFLSLDYKKELLHVCTGLRNSIPKPLFWSMKCSLPSFVVQKRIANFLDEKTILIDQIIEKKQKQIDLLHEKRTAAINQAVTRGLDPDIDLTYSGIAWISKVPKNWKMEKLKFVAPLRNLKIQAGMVKQKYLGLENIESGTGKLIYTDQDVESESILNLFSAGDVLFGKLRPYLSKVVAPDFGGVCTGELLDLVPNKNKITQKFLFYKLISRDFIRVVDDSTYGTKMPRANWEFIGNQIISFPNIEQQQQITNLLDNKLGAIDVASQKIEKSIEVLKEFKSTLISSVVTGKIKIK